MYGSSLLKYFFLLLLLLSKVSCRRYVCPAYQSTYQFSTTPPNKYGTFFPKGNPDERMMSAPKIFLPFYFKDSLSDSDFIPKGDSIKSLKKDVKNTIFQKIRYGLFGKKSLKRTKEELILGRRKKWNGILPKEESSFFSKVENQQKNIHRLIRAKASFPPDLPLSLSDSNTLLASYTAPENIEQTMYKIRFGYLLEQSEKRTLSERDTSEDSLPEDSDIETDLEEKQKTDSWKDDSFFKDYEDLIQEKSESTEPANKTKSSRNTVNTKKKKFGFFNLLRNFRLKLKRKKKKNDSSANTELKENN